MFNNTESNNSLFNIIFFLANWIPEITISSFRLALISNLPSEFVIVASPFELFITWIPSIERFSLFLMYPSIIFS